MIDATLTPSVAANRHWDAIVVGGGPGGSAAAIRLARAGRRVLLVDRAAMPRAKVCGCCLSPTALAELEGLDAFAASEARPVVLEAVQLVAGGHAARLPLAGATLSREALDTALVARAIRDGADWLPQATVASIAETTDHVRLTVRPAVAPSTPLLLEADHAVIATGLADHVRIECGHASPNSARRREPRRLVAPKSRIGIGLSLAATASDLAAGDLIMVVGRGGYAGIVRLEDGRIDIAAALAPQAVATAGRPQVAIAALLEEALAGAGLRLDLAAVNAAHVRATPALTHRAPLVAGSQGRLCRIGDAAGYVEPFTGEGMGWALVSGRLLAEAIVAGGPPAAIAATFSRGHDAFFAAHHARCRRVALAVRHPWLVRAAIRLARFAPSIAAGAMPFVVGSPRPAPSAALREAAA
ncbi:MAG: NAD(P)/FAD-dependent oxidoreductase [Planctomycetia bacterium]|jgi:flavin-dependent dehydrogenase